MQAPVRLTYHGYAAPTLIAPEWTVSYLVFQAGIPRLKSASITGGGQVYGHEYLGFFRPVVKGYTPAISSLTGGGQIPSSPPFLTRLFGGGSQTQ